MRNRCKLYLELLLYFKETSSLNSVKCLSNKKIVKIRSLNPYTVTRIIQTTRTHSGNRLPLEDTFLLALRAKCLSIQRIDSIEIKEYCNDLAFYSTRRDTSLKFRGLGLTFFDDQRTKIQSIIYRFSLKIPILDGRNLQQLEIVNLGRYFSIGNISRVTLPEHGILNQNNNLFPLNVDKCTKLRSSTMCPVHAIMPFDPCLDAVYHGNHTSSCSWTKQSTVETCSKYDGATFTIISLSAPSVIHYGILKNRHIF